jgi:hypothetical protein
MRAWVVASQLLLAALLACACNSTETRFTGIEPNTGTFVGGEEVTLSGQNFPRGGVLVQFGDKVAQPAVMESDHRIRVTTPAGDKNTNSDVTLVFDDGRAFVLKNGFRYVDSTQQRNTMDKFFDKASKSAAHADPARK